MTTACIFCQRTDREESVEHIIPRTLGNIHYVLAKGEVCAVCNNRFGLQEQKVLQSRIFLAERKKYGLLNKKADHQTIEKLPVRAYQIFLLKMGYEAMYKSQRKIWRIFDFSYLLDFVLKGEDHSIFTIPIEEQYSFQSIPRWLDRWRLANNHLYLGYSISPQEALYFRFQFGTIRSDIRLA